MAPKPGTSPLKIVGYEPDANLREVSWNQMFLERIKEEHRLKHREAVLFINSAHDRFRLVACFYGLAVLILPPVDKEDRISLYLKVSEFLKKFSTGFKAGSQLLEEETSLARERISKKREKLAKAAQAKRKVIKRK